MSYAIRDLDHAGSLLARFLLGLFRADRDEGQEFKLLEIRPTGEINGEEAVPQRLNTIARPSASQAVRSREFILDRDSRINGSRMNPAVINQIVFKDDIEVWQITDASPNFLTFHVHDVQFLIVDRNGRPPDGASRGGRTTFCSTRGIASGSWCSSSTTPIRTTPICSIATFSSTRTWG